MRKMVTALLLCIAAQFGSVASANEPAQQLNPKEVIAQSDFVAIANEPVQQQSPKEVIGQSALVASADDTAQQLSTKKKIFGAQTFSKCGYPPYPPYGCKVGACVCDGQGQNCQWTFICK